MKANMVIAKTATEYLKTRGCLSDTGVRAPAHLLLAAFRAIDAGAVEAAEKNAVKYAGRRRWRVIRDMCVLAGLTVPEMESPIATVSPKERKKHVVRGKIFRRQKTLAEAAEILRQRGFLLNGSSGLDPICNAVAEAVGRPVPHTRDERWALIAGFVGEAPTFPATAQPTKRGKRDPFHSSREWLALRYEVLKKRGARCECCGSTKSDGATIQVDHVKPRSIFPELSLVETNLQVLCQSCNFGKSNRDSTDWRGGVAA